MEFKVLEIKCLESCFESGYVHLTAEHIQSSTKVTILVSSDDLNNKTYIKKELQEEYETMDKNCRILVGDIL